MNKLSKLPYYLSASLLALAIALPAHAQEAGQESVNQDEAADEATEVEEVVITGSLIPRVTNTGISPVTVVDTEMMEARGLMTLGDVMESFTENSGYSEGKASNLLGRFTTGGEEVNMRGLGAGRTLVLVNGRRIADYPLPFGGEQNGVDFGSIPYSAISRVEYLSSGASAIYGSDAVGGVINLITKRDMEQTSANVTTGMYQGGYGGTGRASVITGNSFDRGSFTVGVEGTFASEILASDSEWMSENAPYNAGMVSITDHMGDSLLPSGACATLGFELDGDLCSQDISNTISLNPKYTQYSTFFDGRFDLTDNIELFATGMLAANKVTSNSSILFWDGVIVRDDESAATFLTRGFSTDELGTSDITNDQMMWTATVGAKGGFEVRGDTWYWDLALSHAHYTTDSTSINLKEEGIRDWILDGASSVSAYPDQRYTFLVDSAFYDTQLVDNIVRPVQPSDIAGLVGENRMSAESSSTSLFLTVNGELGDLGVLYKPLKFAVLAELARQTTEIKPDARSLNTTGEGWYGIGAMMSKGERERRAAAVEFEAPVLSNLDVSLAARWDHYDDASSIEGRMSGQVKFLYRPTDWLKIRGGYSQTFRAPDMFNIYGRTDAFQGIADFSAPGCYDGVSYICGFRTISTTRQADAGLTEEHGDDLGFGLIWTPVDNLYVTVDWYEINLNDLVITESAQDLVLKEWQCANGGLDPSSQLCADVNNRIFRNGVGSIERIVVQPINQDSLMRQGVDIRASYTYESEKLGSFTASVNHSKTLAFELTRFDGDAAIGLRYGEPGASTPENVTGVGLQWSNPLSAGKGVAAGLYVQRYGRVYNFSHTQFMEPMYDVNLSAGYQINAKASVNLSVNNLLDEKPQNNDSGFWPNYWAHMQTGNALGRSAYLSFSYSFQ